MLSALISERELPLLQSISDIRVRQVGKDRLEAITVTLVRNAVEPFAYLMPHRRLARTTTWTRRPLSRS